MERIPVASSNIAEIGYDPESQTLEILFHGGRLYRYYNVPQFHFERLIEAASVGGYFNAEIRGQFPEERG
jgi:hypothetical protein